MLKISVLLASVAGCVAMGCMPAMAQNAYQVVEGCHYPKGWNVTDFDRDIQGIPEGRGHECLDTYSNGHLVKRTLAQ